jgi:hypothetical protein
MRECSELEGLKRTGSWPISEYFLAFGWRNSYLQDSQCPADIRTLDLLNRDTSTAALIYLFQEVIWRGSKWVISGSCLPLHPVIILRKWMDKYRQTRSNAVLTELRALFWSDVNDLGVFPVITLHLSVSLNIQCVTHHRFLILQLYVFLVTSWR